LKRVDGLEARLKDKKTDPEAEASENAVANPSDASSSAQSLSITTADSGHESDDTKLFSPTQPG
jgi:hypothetical protein